MARTTLFLFVGQRNKLAEYSGLEPTSVTSRHFEYIKQAKALRSKSEASLYTEYIMIQYLFDFLELKNISTLSVFSYPKLQELFSYLKTIQTKYGKPLSISSQRLVYSFFKSFSKWLYQYHPNEAPSLEIFQKSPYKSINNHLKTSFFSDHVLKQIKKAVVKEDDIYTKTYILVSLYYGLRSGDIISLKSDCLTLSDKDGKYDLHYIDQKQKESVVIPAISPPVSRSILALIDYTKEYRKLLGINHIFVERKPSGKIKLLSPYQNSKLNKFVKIHQILDESGSLAKITSHMFRRTLATNLQSHGSSLEATQTVLNHKNKRTTLKHYIKTKDEDYISQISNTLNHMQIISTDEKSNILKSSFDFNMALRLPDGYCANTLMITDKEYMCDTFQKRGNCYGCTKMVTTPEFLPYFRDLMKEKETEIETKSLYGSHVVKHIEFEKDLIESLIEKLENMESSL